MLMTSVILECALNQELSAPSSASTVAVNIIPNPLLGRHRVLLGERAGLGPMCSLCALCQVFT